MVEGSSAVELLKQFEEVQGRRAQLYSRFEAGFRRYLETRQEGIYRRLLAELTGQFAEVSKEVIDLEASLRDGRGRGDLADMLRGVQQNEREKLRLTLALQALKAAYEKREFSWQQEQQDDRAVAAAKAAKFYGQQPMRTGLAGISMAHGGAPDTAPASGSSSSNQSGHAGHDSHSHHHERSVAQDHMGGEAEGGGPGSVGHAACGCGAPAPPEPSEAEYGNAVSEAIRQLQEVVLAINDLLDEIKYEVAEHEGAEEALVEGQPAPIKPQ